MFIRVKPEYPHKEYLINTDHIIKVKSDGVRARIDLDEYEIDSDGNSSTTSMWLESPTYKELRDTLMFIGRE